MKKILYKYPKIVNTFTLEESIKIPRDYYRLTINVTKGESGEYLEPYYLNIPCANMDEVTTNIEKIINLFEEK